MTLGLITRDMKKVLDRGFSSGYNDLYPLGFLLNYLIIHKDSLRLNPKDILRTLYLSSKKLLPKDTLGRFEENVMPRVNLEKMVDKDKPREPKFTPIQEVLIPANRYPDQEVLRKVPGSPYFVDVTTGVIYLDKVILDMIK